MAKKILVTYATTSKFKREEIPVILDTINIRLPDGSEAKMGDRFEFCFSDVRTDEPLEVDLGRMVHHKAISAYRALLMPCIVEHAGIIFEKDIAKGFPGGLTQPMMDSLEAEGFLSRTSAGGEPAIARAVIGYCDGMSVEIFTGDTKGVMADRPKGGREFYWDTIFSPDGYGGRTYAEITSDPALGVPEKMKISQSAAALKVFAESRLKRGPGTLFNQHFDG